MLVGAGEKISIEAHHALPAGNGVAGDRGVRVTNMRPRIHIIDRRRDIEGFAHCVFKKITGTELQIPLANSAWPGPLIP